MCPGLIFQSVTPTAGLPAKMTYNKTANLVQSFCYHLFFMIQSFVKVYPQYITVVRLCGYFAFVYIWCGASVEINNEFSPLAKKFTLRP